MNHRILNLGAGTQSSVLAIMCDRGDVEPVECAIFASDRINEVVIETTSGKVNRHRHKGGGAGLAIHGWAVGYILKLCDLLLEPIHVHRVTENDWTRGISKARRQLIVSQITSDYMKAKDPGGDVSDAIALGRWWFVEGQHRKPQAAAEGAAA